MNSCSNVCDLSFYVDPLRSFTCVDVVRIISDCEGVSEEYY